MEYRPLGNSGILVSEVGFGAWGIGGAGNGAKAYGPTDDGESRLALRAAFERGVTFYDTSPLYGYGHSEELIGEVFAGKRQDVVISSKVGFVNFDGEQDFAPESIRRSIEDSLRRLRTDYLDVFQLHDPPMQLLRDDERVLQTMADLRSEGKVRAVGISTRSPRDSLDAVGLFPFQSVQLNFNLVDQRAAEEGAFAKCSEAGVGVICRTPLCFGFLTGRYGADDEYDEADHRSNWSQQQRESWANAYRLFVADLQDSLQQTNAQLALRYCLSFPAISTAIPGMLTRAHVEENAASSGLGPFPPDILDSFAGIYNNNTFFIRG